MFPFLTSINFPSVIFILLSDGMENLLLSVVVIVVISMRKRCTLFGIMLVKGWGRGEIGKEDEIKKLLQLALYL